MTAGEVIRTRRTIRKFTRKPVTHEQLVRFVECATLAPSAANVQPIKYKLISEAGAVEAVFPLLKWAGYIAPAGNPQAGEEPTAYIVVLGDHSIRKAGYELDAGAAIQNILLAAWEEGVGSCWIGSVDRPALTRLTELPDQYEIIAVLALGYPAECSVAESRGAEGIKYYKDEQGAYHVPKRPCSEVIL